MGAAWAGADPADLRFRESDWRRLERETSATPFQTYAWSRTWLRHFGRGARPWILAAGSPPEALLPLVIWRAGPLRILRLWGQDRLGYGPGDYLGPIGVAGRPAVAAELGRRLDARGDGYDLLSFASLRMGPDALEAFSGALPGRVVPGPPETCLAIDARGSWEGFLADRSKSFRASLDSTARRVSRYGDVRVAPESASPPLLAEMVDVERASWKWEAGQSFFRDPRLRRFLEDLLLRSGIAAEVWTCRVDGALAAYDVSLVEGSTRFSWLTAYRDDRSGTGTHLLAELTRATLASEYETLDLMQGDDPYKRRWADQVGAVHRLAGASGPAGRAGVAAARLRWRLQGSERLRRLRVDAQRWWRSLRGAGGDDEGA